ncbi:MAG: hypothetical protein IPG83_01920 [Novosphingobium sp.]|nr:hypothetical protein [Novosphingobium sp.]
MRRGHLRAGGHLLHVGFLGTRKRQLSTYRNGEIKALLADLLGQEDIRALGQKRARRRGS